MKFKITSTKNSESNFLKMDDLHEREIKHKKEKRDKNVQIKRLKLIFISFSIIQLIISSSLFIYKTELLTWIETIK